MRFLIGSVLIVTAGVLLSQSSQDIRNRYGEPDRERFAARPGISLTTRWRTGERLWSSKILQDRTATIMSNLGCVGTAKQMKKGIEEIRRRKQLLLTQVITQTALTVPSFKIAKAEPERR